MGEQERCWGQQRHFLPAHQSSTEKLRRSFAKTSRDYLRGGPFILLVWPHLSPYQDDEANQPQTEKQVQGLAQVEMCSPPATGRSSEGIKNFRLAAANSRGGFEHGQPPREKIQYFLEIPRRVGICGAWFAFYWLLAMYAISLGHPTRLAATNLSHLAAR